MLLHTETREWSNGPEMNIARYSHGCTTALNTTATEQSNAHVIVVGGNFSTAEVLYVSSSSWSIIAQMPLQGLYRNSLAASKSSEYILYSIGGNYLNETLGNDLGVKVYVKAIYGLTYSNTWIHVGDLTEGRDRHTSLNVARKDIPGCS